MSDLCVYELEDSIWGEFGDSSDCAVPHSADEYGNQFAVLADSRKKPRREVVGVRSDTAPVTKYGIEANVNQSLIYKDTMLEKGPWSHATDGGSPASCDVTSVKDMINMSSENSRMSTHTFNSGRIDPVDNDFCTGDPILGDSTNAANTCLYNYSLNRIPETENNLSFLDSECAGKGNDDLFYGWTEIGNFEDVDEMFRSCDSTFGLGNLGNEDDLSWFSSSQPAEKSEVALTSESKPSKTSENHETDRAKKEVPLTDDDSKKNVVVADSRSRDVSNGVLGHLSTMEVSDTKPQMKVDLMPNEQAHLNKKQSKCVDQPEEKRNRYMENGVSFHHSENSNQIFDMKNQYGNSTRQYHPPSTFQQTCMPYTHLNYDQSSDQMSVCQTISGIKSENNVNPSSSSNESSFASNQAQSMESIHGPVFEASYKVRLDNAGKLQRHQNMHPSFATSIENGNRPTVMEFSRSAPFQKIEDQSEVKRVSDNPAELDPSNAQESSCVSSVLDDISLEAASFRQLQQVIEQLDVRTKLCIRDSLYRLAKSAQQRHNGMNPSGETHDEKDAAPSLMAGGANKYVGFVDMETDTNPIDRSIAHLLFHRPSDSSLVPPNDALAYKPKPMIPQPTSSPSLMVQNQDEKTIAAADDNVQASNDK